MEKIYQNLPVKNLKQKIIDSILRVNHSGEFGAQQIYKGQLYVTKDPELKSLIQKMYEQEKIHLRYFETKLISNRTRPSPLIPLWQVGGFALGAITAYLGKETAMLCTKVVEEVIAEHYSEQIKILNHQDFAEQNELKETIKNFREEELEHHDIAHDNFADNAPFSRLIKFTIQGICKMAIKVSKL